MSPFALLELPIAYIDGRNWRVTADFGFTAKGGRRVVALAGSLTDFASTPRFLWPVLPPTGDGPGKTYGPAAVLHDVLYRSGQFADGSGCTRTDADQVLYDAMVELQVRVLTRWAIYLGVRLGGWLTWWRYRHARARA